MTTGPVNHIFTYHLKCLQIKVNINQWYKKNAAELNVKSIYKTLPNAKVALDGATPEPRFIWKEKDWPSGFPDSPEEAKTDVMTYLEQRDCYRRLQKLDVKDFSVGSTVAVTRADPYIAKGKVRSVIICVCRGSIFSWVQFLFSFVLVYGNV